jgi:hypothetical protein
LIDGKQKNIGLGTSLQKLEPKYSYGLFNDQNLDFILESIYMGHFLLDWWFFSLQNVCQKDV